MINHSSPPPAWVPSLVPLKFLKLYLGIDRSSILAFSSIRFALMFNYFYLYILCYCFIILTYIFCVIASLYLPTYFVLLLIIRTHIFCVITYYSYLYLCVTKRRIWIQKNFQHDEYKKSVIYNSFWLGDNLPMKVRKIMLYDL